MLNASHFDNNIHKLPPDIQDLVNKKQKFLNMGFNSKSIEECKIPTSPMWGVYSKICKNFPGKTWDEKLEEIKQSYLSEFQKLWLDLDKHPLYINFFSPISNSVSFFCPREVDRWHEFYFKASHFLPYYAGFFRYSDPQKNWNWWGFAPESPEQEEIARIFKEFFKNHGHTEASHDLLNISLPIIGDHRGGEDEHPYRVYELLFGE